MRPLLLAIPVCLLCLAPPAGAQSGNYPSPDTTPIATVQVTAPFQLTEAEADAVSGRYAMSNGWRMKVEQASPTGIVAQIERRRPIRLMAVTADKFVSLDGNVSMDFNRGKDGDEMMMSYVPDPRFAVRYVITATLAQR